MDGASVGAVTGYEFTNVTAGHTISASFAINPIVVTSPNGGESWEVGSLKTITWNAKGVRGLVRIELSRDGGATWSTIVPLVLSNGHQTWRVTGTSSAHARIRITSLGGSVFDISDADFSIVR